MNWDVIVVGAGSGGCAAAARLGEQGHRVLLLEAGGRGRRLEVQIPAAFSKLFKSDLDWGYETLPQTHLHNRRSYWPRGKVLGGSSAINAMIYTTGHPADYDRWRDLGNIGWGWDDVAPWFDRLALIVETQRSPNLLSHAFLQAIASEGFPQERVFLGARGQTSGFFQTTTRNGRRWSAANAYLGANAPSSVTLWLNTKVSRVVVEEGRAVGVEAVRDGQHVQLRARVAVVLAGGALNSPHLLLASGIGPASDLIAAGIPVVVDLPGVGHNLQDHLTAGLTHRCTQPITLDRADTVGNLMRWLFTRRGPLRSPVAEAGAFWTDDARPGGQSDIEFIFGPVWFSNHGFHRPSGDYYTIGAVLLHPASRGTVRLAAGQGAASRIVIDPEYLTASADHERLLEAFRRLRRIAAHEAFAPYRGSEVLPGLGTESDGDILTHLRATAETLYHPVGTCKMGTDRDPLAVVDARLRVRGLDGLRIADASVMPEIISGHTHAPTVMIGERLARMVGEDQR